MEPLIPVLYTISIVGFLLHAGRRTGRTHPVLTGDPDLDGRLAYQGLLLAASAVSLGTAFLLEPESLRRFFSIGWLDAPAIPLALFGIGPGERWLEVALSLGLVITIVTSSAMYLNLRKAGIRPHLPDGAGWILLLSLSNAFGEEMVCRVGLIAPLAGRLEPTLIFLISAAIFGLAHYRGMPSGVTGVFLAGILGFLLAKSVYETGGFFWAVMIHFVQDVIIIGSMFMMRGLDPDASGWRDA